MGYTSTGLVLGALVFLSGCTDDDAGSGTTLPNAFEQTPLGLTIDTGSTPGVTAAGAVLVVGETAEAGSTVVITGGMTAVQAVSGPQRSFQVSVPLQPNKRNVLLARELFAGGAEGEGLPFSIVQDSTAPGLWIDFPADGQVLSSPTTTVIGRVSDALSGFMGLEVNVNGVAANVDVGIGTNGTFELPGVALVEGEVQSIVVRALDLVGNASTRTVDVEYAVPTGFVLEQLGGNGQSGAVDTGLSEPIGVRLSCPDGTPLVGKVVSLRVVKSNGVLATSAEFGDPDRTLQLLTDANGEVEAYWRLGSDAGCGNNRVEVTSIGLSGAGFFCASATAAEPDQINVGSMTSQVTSPGAPAMEPLRAWVSDGCNGVGGVPVTFTVVNGQGMTLRDEEAGVNTQGSITVLSSITGHAEVTLFAGADPGLYEVEATFPGLVGLPARFTVKALPEGPDGATVFEGIVFDNSERPLGGATVILAAGDESLETTTDATGLFSFPDVTMSGLAGLEVIGDTITSISGSSVPSGTRFPNLHYEFVVFEGRVNQIVGPVKLPPLISANDRSWDGESDITLELGGVEGLEFTVRAGSMTLKDGSVPSPSNPVQLAVNQVHHGDIPMPMPNGVAPPFAWTLQPAEAVFDPPIEISYPNMTGLAAGSAAYFLSFDHATGQFEIVSSASVSEDGSVITTDAGSGLTVSGWGCNCPPYAAVADCDDCEETCVSPGSLSIEGSETMAMPSIPSFCADHPVEVHFAAPAVLDSGGGMEIACADGSGQSMEVPPVAPTYTWTILDGTGQAVLSGEGQQTISFIPHLPNAPYRAEFEVRANRPCPPDPLVIQSLPLESVDLSNVSLTGPPVKMKNQPTSAPEKSFVSLASAGEFDLALLLNSEGAALADDLIWFDGGQMLDGTSVLTYSVFIADLEFFTRDIQVRHVACPDHVIDEILMVIISDSTFTNHVTWLAANQDLSWLAGLPAPYPALGNGGADPEPAGCDNWSTPSTLSNNYHPGASSEMRAGSALDSHGHQATYNAAGALITSDLAAGTADRGSSGNPFLHVPRDVLPYIRAAQLDGNAVGPFPGTALPADLTGPLMTRGTELDRYLQLRPPIANNASPCQ